MSEIDLAEGDEMDRKSINRLKGATVLVTLAVVQFVSMQLLLSAYATTMLVREMQRAQELRVLRPEPVKLTTQRPSPRNHSARD